MSLKKASSSHWLDSIGYLFLLTFAVSLFNSFVQMALVVVAALLIVCLILRPYPLLILVLTGAILALMHVSPMVCVLAATLFLLALTVKIVIDGRLRKRRPLRLEDRSAGRDRGDFA